MYLDAPLPFKINAPWCFTLKLCLSLFPPWVWILIVWHLHQHTGSTFKVSVIKAALQDTFAFMAAHAMFADPETERPNILQCTASELEGIFEEWFQSKKSRMIYKLIKPLIVVSGHLLCSMTVGIHNTCFNTLIPCHTLMPWYLMTHIIRCPNTKMALHPIKPLTSLPTPDIYLLRTY